MCSITVFNNFQLYASKLNDIFRRKLLQKVEKKAFRTVCYITVLQENCFARFAFCSYKNEIFIFFVGKEFRIKFTTSFGWVNYTGKMWELCWRKVRWKLYNTNASSAYPIFEKGENRFLSKKGYGRLKHLETCNRNPEITKH